MTRQPTPPHFRDAVTGGLFYMRDETARAAWTRKVRFYRRPIVFADFRAAF
jgi:hypothetical protein